MKWIIAAIILTILIIGGGSYLVVKSSPSQLSADQSAVATITETSFDWGTIGINNGKVQKTFAIKNSGSSPLKLNNVVTSCMCTTAQVVINGQSSPAFGMHAKSGWGAEVLPGQSADLVVVFDPAFHGPSGVGVITRIITVDTNDSKNSQLSFNLTANVVN